MKVSREDTSALIELQDVPKTKKQVRFMEPVSHTGHSISLVQSDNDDSMSLTAKTAILACYIAGGVLLATFGGALTFSCTKEKCSEAELAGKISMFALGLFITLCTLGCTYHKISQDGKNQGSETS